MKLFIDWDKLDGELYSVIAHASAGTDFCSPDLQLAVDGCINEVRRALKASENAEQKTETVLIIAEMNASLGPNGERGLRERIADWAARLSSIL